MNNKKSIITKTIISSLITLIPSIIALVCQLFFKEQMYKVVGKTIWDTTIPFSLYLPIVLVLINALCVFITFKLENKVQNKKVTLLIFSIIPFVSLFTNAIVWFAIMESKINVFSVFAVFFGLLFATIGNLMPKITQNKTFGIKIHWTLVNEANWNATHRFAGKIWFFTGLAFIIAAFLPEKLLIVSFFILLFINIIIPIIYSFTYYKNQVKNGTWSESPVPPYSKKVVVIATVVSVLIVIFCIFITVTGEINISLDEQKLTVTADYWSDADLYFSEIEKIEYVSSVKGTRISGFETPRLLMGTFKNDTFGTYTRYTYAQNKTAIIITYNDNIYVINAKTQNETNEIYKKLLSLCEK